MYIYMKIYEIYYKLYLQIANKLFNITRSN